MAWIDDFNAAVQGLWDSITAWQSAKTTRDELTTELAEAWAASLAAETAHSEAHIAYNSAAGGYDDLLIAPVAALKRLGSGYQEAVTAANTAVIAAKELLDTTKATFDSARQAYLDLLVTQSDSGSALVAAEEAVAAAASALVTVIEAGDDETTDDTEPEAPPEPE